MRGFKNGRFEPSSLEAILTLDDEFKRSDLTNIEGVLCQVRNW
jgi:hypothetical protein